MSAQRTKSGPGVNEAIARLRNEVAIVEGGSLYERAFSNDILDVCVEVESLQAEVERLRQSVDHMVWWLISENYEHAASSLAVYLYPGSAAPLRRYAQDHPEYAPVIDEISWVPKVTT